MKKNKNDYYPDRACLTADTGRRLRRYKRLYGHRTMNDAVLDLLDQVEYGCPTKELEKHDRGC